MKKKLLLALLMSFANAPLSAMDTNLSLDEHHSGLSFDKLPQVIVWDTITYGLNQEKCMLKGYTSDGYLYVRQNPDSAFYYTKEYEALELTPEATQQLLAAIKNNSQTRALLAGYFKSFDQKKW